MRAFFSSSGKITVTACILAFGLFAEVFTLQAQNIGQEDLPEIALRDTSYIRELNDRAADLIEQSNLNAARDLIEEALQLAILLNDLDGESYAMSNLTGYYLERGLPDSVLTVVGDNFSRFKNTEKEIQLGNQIANAHNMVGNYQQGLELYLEMRDLAIERGETRMEIGITQNLGNNYKSLGDIPTAMDHYLRSLEMAEEISDTLIIAVVLDNLASVNVNEGNFEIGEQYLMQALEMNKQINNLGNQITNHMSLGGLYKQMQQFEQAQSHYDTVLEIAENIGNTLAKIQALYNIGLLKLDLEEYELALEYFEESLELSEENNIMIGLYFNQNGMGNVYSELGEYETAIDLFESALEIAEMARAADLIIGSLENLYMAYESMSDTSQAYIKLKRYSALTDSMSRTARDEALARQEALLELRTERENRALLEENLSIQQTNTLIASVLLIVIIIALVTVIILLQKKRKANALLRKQSEELSQVNEIKDKLLSVLAHDLRTPLSSLQGVVYMIREKVLEKEDAEKALSQIDAQLQQDINTLSNYLQWAQTQREGITAELEIVSLTYLAKNAFFEIDRGAKNKQVNLENRIPENTYALADKQMMRIILRNLLSNAIKYVEEGDRIIIDAKETDTAIEILISDTGSGIPLEKQEDLFKPFNYVQEGTAGEKGTGLGLSICKEFVEEQGGNITFKSDPGKGTTFTISLQKATVKEPVSESV